jgi:hypothetical protein
MISIDRWELNLMLGLPSVQSEEEGWGRKLFASPEVRELHDGT